MKRLSIVVALFLSACGQSSRTQSLTAGPTGPGLATFTGVADLGAGRVVISTTPSSSGASAQMPSIALPAGAVTIQNSSPYWANDPDHGCGAGVASWGAGVTVTNQYVGGPYVSGVFARIDVATPAPAATPCTNVSGPDGWDPKVGLFSFGATSTLPSAQSTWAFRRISGDGVTFSGTIYGAKVSPVTDALRPPVTGQARAVGATVYYPSYNGFGKVAADGTVTAALNLPGLNPGAIAVDGSRIWWVGWRGSAGFTDLNGANPNTALIASYIAPVTNPNPPPNEFEVDIGYGVALDPVVPDTVWLLTSSEGLGNPAVGLGADQGALRSMNSALAFTGPFRFPGNPGGIVALAFTDTTTQITSTKLYVTNINGNTVDVWDTTDMATHASIPVADGCEAPGPIIQGPDGDLWFTAGTAICKMTLAGVVTLAAPASGPTGICVGPGNSVWYASTAGLTRVYANGAVDSHPWLTQFSSALSSNPVTCTYSAGTGLWAAEGFGGNNGVLRFELFEP